MIAKWLSNSVLTAPMAFIAFGVFISTSHLLPQKEAEISLHLVAEVALVVLLFLDAAQIDLNALRQRNVWPVRMLVVGFPIMIILGTIAAIPFLPGWPLVAVVLVASILAPTDAALGKAVVRNPFVSDRGRRALSIESGFNDGLALPVVLAFASLTAEVMNGEQINWFLFGAMQLTLGPLAGVVIGILGGKLLLIAKQLDLTEDIYEGIGTLALAGAAYLAATLIGGNGFISAFVAGLCFGNVVKGQCKFVYEFTESEGQILIWSAFFLLGLALVPQALAHLTLSNLGLILVSLFVVRPIAIWISLIGTDATPLTRLFFGWFGPSGLASALFALLILQQLNHELAEPILYLVVNTVWISALLHGLSATPVANWYAAKISAMGEFGETQ